ncbi:type II secretion protein, partial [Staphylococcus aureus]|nr:type II secretion protein [Staphylococcus aureus]
SDQDEVRFQELFENMKQNLDSEIQRGEVTPQ